MLFYIESSEEFNYTQQQLVGDVLGRRTLGTVCYHTIHPMQHL